MIRIICDLYIVSSGQLSSKHLTVRVFLGSFHTAFSIQGLHTTLKYIHRILEDSRYNLAFANLVAKMGPKPKKSLDNSLNTSLEEMDSETTVKEQVSHQGFLYKDTKVWENDSS